MYEWLDKELSAINTPRFHLVESSVDSKLREAVSESIHPLPQSYKVFVLKYGNARLYRRVRNNSYQVGVFAGPRESILKDGTLIFHIGFHDGASVYIKSNGEAQKFSVFEFENNSESRVANDFSTWLEESCANARRSYGKEKWEEILQGPRPFDSREKGIVEARSKIAWRDLGIDRQGFHIIEIANRGNRTLPAITLGVRSKDSQLNGAIRLAIRNVNPGQTLVIHADCYKGLVAPEDIEIYSLPDPQPEDREYYWEFG